MDTATHPSPELRSDLMLAAALRILQPLVESLVREGVQHGTLSRELKPLFVDAARRVLAETGAKQTDSALTLMSGVHRKDLRAMAAAEDMQSGPPKALSPLTAVFTRWATDPAFRDPSGQVLALPKAGPTPSFQSLAESVTRDVHHGSLLDSLLRLGVVNETEAGLVALSASGFVPQGNLRELLSLFSGNASDHLAAATVNLRLPQPKFLEHSVFADELSQASIAALHGEAVNLWSSVFKQFAIMASQRCEQDAGAENNNQRLRFGAYFYAAPM